MSGRNFIALVAGAVAGFFGARLIRSEKEDTSMERLNRVDNFDLSDRPSEPVQPPESLNTAILRGEMDPDGVRRVLREAIAEGNLEDERAAADEMKRFLRENPVRL